ncbi:hypothetical protein GCM10023187_52970 [Nibrella viscosa]|uniref:Lipoprotein n=1 Tax=Nibrella viscosa TaxID=1084524 RepID=A0ABP8KZ19_9BACT
MKLRINFLSVIVIFIACGLVSWRGVTEKTGKLAVSGCLKGSTNAIVRVYEEMPDNTKGRLLVAERWINTDEIISVTTERGRIIFEYRYRGSDPWNTEVHAWANSCSLPTRIP